jgi:hypothetical protein
MSGQSLHLVDGSLGFTGKHINLVGKIARERLGAQQFSPLETALNH